MASRKSLLVCIKQRKALIHPIENSRNLPAMVGWAEVNLNRPGLELIIEVLNARKASPIDVGFRLFQVRLALKAYPEISPFSVRDPADINVPRRFVDAFPPFVSVTRFSRSCLY